ncbi:GNAT family N-acetyltransferase [Halorientalis sp.]|nr:GNAT family protein [Halorientalis sp.]
MAVLDKLGFQQEGRLRKQDYVRGAYRDRLLFGLLADEHER